MKLCEEMKRLRDGLDKRKVKWTDASDIWNDDKIKACGVDCTIYRTQFDIGDTRFSVIYGHGTYGSQAGLLECMSSVLNGGEPVGDMAAENVLNLVDESLKKAKSDQEDIEAEIKAHQRYLDYENMIHLYTKPLQADFFQSKIMNEVLPAITVKYNIDVDKDELLKALRYDRDEYCKGYKKGYAEGRKANTAHWIINPDGYYPQCSNCGFEPPRELIRYTKSEAGTTQKLIFPRYCPECGYDTNREVK